MSVQVIRSLSSTWYGSAQPNLVGSRVGSLADTLIWLDYPLAIILGRLFRRTLRCGMRREILWGTNQERLWTQFLSPKSLFLWALQTYPRFQREYPILLNSPAYQHIHAIRLRSPAEASNWLANT
jgi:hypothetical protein